MSCLQAACSCVVKLQEEAVQNEETWQCTVCGHVHHGDMPDDFVCPICKQGKAAFVKKD